MTVLAEKYDIKEIIAEPMEFNQKLVIVDGLVSQWVPGEENSTSHYMLEDEYGNSIQINTSSNPPETQKKYRVSGIVYFDTQTGNVFISEQGRLKLDRSGEESTDSGYGFIFIIVGVVAAFILYRFYMSKKKKVSSAIIEDAGEGDFQTIKLSASEAPKTLQFLPGELKIISGTDSGKIFKIAGYPTDEGKVVTIGREEVIGERGYAHIKLMESTVSRKQAEIIQTDKELKVKNISTTNLTEVDGIVLKPNQEVELKPNSTIKIGEIVFQYIV